MRAEVVHHYEVSGAKGGRQCLLVPGTEHPSVDRSVEHQWGDQAFATQRTDEGGRLPVPLGHPSWAALPVWRTSPARAHVRDRPGLVEKHHAAHVEAGSLGGPGCPRLRDVGPLLLGGLE